MSYYDQNQPPVGNPPPQGYPHQDYPKDAYPPPGYPQQGYPQPGYPQQGYPQPGYPPQGGYPPQYAPQYAQQQPQNKSSGLMEGCRWVPTTTMPKEIRLHKQSQQTVWLLSAVAVYWTRAFDENLWMKALIGLVIFQCGASLSYLLS